MISVIIPIYNAEPYLRRCIDSVLDSTYRAFELILVDDGSTDGSLRICEEYSDCRIKLIIQKHQGVSAARNRGLEECSGEWVVFVDADDLISRDFLALIAGEEADLLLFDFAQTEQELVSGGKAAEKIHYGDEHTLEFLKRILVPVQLRENGSVNFNSPCAKAYRKSIIALYALRFSTDLFFGEDKLFNLEYQMKAANTLYIPRRVYFYNIHDDSSSHRFDSEFLRNHLRLVKEIQSVLEAGGRLSAVKNEYVSFSLNVLVYYMVHKIFVPGNPADYSKKCRLCQMIREDERYRQLIKWDRMCRSWQERVIVVLFRFRCCHVISLISRWIAARSEKKR